MLAPDSTSPLPVRRFQRDERRFRRILGGGFALVLLLMIGSVVVGLVEMRKLGEATEAMSGRYLAQTRLVEDLERQQGAIGILLYNVADGSAASIESSRREAGLRRQTLMALVNDARQAELPQAEREAWDAVGVAAKQLFDELDRLLQEGRGNSPKLSGLLSTLMQQTAGVMDLSYSDISQDRAVELSKDSGIIQGSTAVMVGSISLAVVCAILSVVAAITLFRGVERQAETLAKLSVHTFAEQEDLARRFSQEMHDEFGQTLNAIESNLATVEAKDAEHQSRVRDAIVLAKEAQEVARDMSHLMRPRILDDFGLDAGLRELAHKFSRRTGITVDYRGSFHGRLDPAVETHLFRIAQEALTNAARHTLATNIELSLKQENGGLRLRVSDNGGGLKGESSQQGLGLLGMRERARAANGRLMIVSKPNVGVEIVAEVPLALPEGVA